MRRDVQNPYYVNRRSVVFGLAGNMLLGGTSLPPQTTQNFITFGGLNRSYLLYLPASSPPAGGYPVIIGFHGGGEDATTFAISTNFTFRPSTQGYLQIYPQGVQNTWNCGNGWFGYAAANNIDDLGFVNAVLTQVSGGFPVDMTHVYATGISNGGEFASYYGRIHSSQIAAVSQTATALRGDTTAPSLPLPMQIIKGTLDPVSPVAGGGPYSAPPFSDLISYWQTASGTTGTTTGSIFSGVVAITNYTGGVATLISYMVTGMGHHWAIQNQGGQFDGNGLFIGPPCPAPVDLTPFIIAFFQNNHR